MVRKIKAGATMKYKEFLSQELEIRGALDYPLVVRLERVFQQGRDIFMIQEYIQEGSLEKVLQAREKLEALSEGQIAMIIKQVLAATIQMHAKGFVHSNI